MKVTWLEGEHMMEMWIRSWATLSKSDQNHYCFFKWKYFLLHILVPYLESFPKHYNKVTFYWVLSKLWNLKVTVPLALSIYACACERDSYARAIYLHCLTYAHAHGIKSNPSQLNDSTFLFFSYSFFFQFFYISRLFRSFFQNEIVDIILILGEAGQNYCRAEKLYRNRYPFRRHPNAMQIRRILLQERRRIHKRNRKQINAEHDVTSLNACGRSQLMRPINIIDWSQKKFHRRSAIPLAEWNVVKKSDAVIKQRSLTRSFTACELQETRDLTSKARYFCKLLRVPLKLKLSSLNTSYLFFASARATLSQVTTPFRGHNIFGDLSGIDDFFGWDGNDDAGCRDLTHNSVRIGTASRGAESRSSIDADGAATSGTRHIPDKSFR